ncbi:hypothetical protein GCM10023230_15230 [Flavobacterium hankyongi]|uniref:Uncharacterized protein n=1 Tax=Flavobacterium hankyongi TaxID=1176532 RepID=A0ABP8ZVE2_9FLAO
MDSGEAKPIEILSNRLMVFLSLFLFIIVSTIDLFAIKIDLIVAIQLANSLELLLKTSKSL